MMSRALGAVEEEFSLSSRDLKKIARDFHVDMERGLRGRASSLKMIPTYVDRPTGNETGSYAALDLGGSNFRVVGLKLKGRGSFSTPAVMKFTLRHEETQSSGRVLFGRLAKAVKKFIEHKMRIRSAHIGLGFTFSFPVRQTGVSGGTLVEWTKGFSARGVEGRDVAALLRRSLKEEGVSNVSLSALVNDTAATLAAKSYNDKRCDVGVIIGTGTNACYVERFNNIKKLKNLRDGSGSMIINIEWGNFNKLKPTRYDRILDRESCNPGAQLLEKMVSGMYIGEICRLIMRELASKNILLNGKLPAELSNKYSFKGEDVSKALRDRSRGLTGVEGLLKGFGASHSSDHDRKIVRGVCEIVMTRAARIGAAAIVSVVTKMDPGLKAKHTVAIDGSVYEKLPGFSWRIRKAIEELAGSLSVKISLSLVKDGSGYGAAIIAAAGRKI